MSVLRAIRVFLMRSVSFRRVSYPTYPAVRDSARQPTVAGFAQPPRLPNPLLYVIPAHHVSQSLMQFRTSVLVRGSEGFEK